MLVSKILIVDDCPVNVSVLEAFLDDEFYETLSVESGDKAIDLAPQFQPDLVLLDVMMPGIDGYDTCRWFRSHPTLKNTRVIMVSANAMQADIERGMQAGADDYVTKPFDVHLLSESIRNWHEARSPS